MSVSGKAVSRSTPKGFDGEGPRGRDLLGELGARHRGGAETAVATRVRDGRGERAVGDATHSGEHHGVFDAEQVGERVRIFLPHSNYQRATTAHGARHGGAFESGLLRPLLKRARSIDVRRSTSGTEDTPDIDRTRRRRRSTDRRHPGRCRGSMRWRHSTTSVVEGFESRCCTS